MTGGGAKEGSCVVQPPHSHTFHSRDPQKAFISIKIGVA